MKISFFGYMRAAFNAKPIGMFVAPNHLALAGITFLGLLSPGFWVLGLGLELAYLCGLSFNARFRRFVRGRLLQEQQQDWTATLDSLLGQLPPEGQNLYLQLEKRCQSVLTRQGGLDRAGLASQGEGLSRLLWMHLRLQIACHGIIRMEQEGRATGDDHKGMEKRLAALDVRLQNPDLGFELRKSLSGQVDILQQRLAKRVEAEEKLAYMQAELVRIQEQVELIREQATLTTDPATLSRRIDEISASLGGTSEWMSHQQQLFGAVEELLVETPPIVAPLEVKQ